MSNKFLFLLICIFFATSTLSCCFSYPLFADLALISSKDQQYINDQHEQENFNQQLKDFKVVSLDWFDVVNNFFPKYTPVKVIDCKTKKSYFVERGGGYNHADVEPIDKTNMLVFKSLYNNEWSWTRRPVWVQIGNSYVAASINGMPHGFSLISNNGIDGHTCIHFLNSKTHGTKLVDKAHQDAVKYALEHSNELKELLLLGK